MVEDVAVDGEEVDEDTAWVEAMDEPALVRDKDLTLLGVTLGGDREPMRVDDERVADELDQVGDRTILTQKESFWEADGWTQLSDIERALGIEFEEEVDANTLSGMFMYLLGRLPKEGDTVEKAGVCFTVESLNGRRVDLVRIEMLEPDSDLTDAS